MKVVEGALTVKETITCLPSHYVDLFHAMMKMDPVPVSICIDDLAPLTVNRQYIRKRGFSAGQFLNPKLKDLRTLTALLLAKKQKVFKGVVHAMICFESPGWLTKDNRIRKKDLDNLCKGVIDAVQHGLSEFRDEVIWSVSACKYPSGRTRTHIWLFDGGETVEKRTYKESE